MKTMNNPILSKKELRKAIIAKPPVRKMRNVLAQPYTFTWPNLKADNVDELRLLLETSMPAIRRSSPVISWANLHKMNKTERQAARMEARLKQDITTPNENIVKSIVLGINGVTRLLEKDNAACILLETKVKPRMMIKHIIIMADLKNVPVILVPSLKAIMLQAVGFACAALALKKTVAEAEDHHFYNLYKKIVELSAGIEKNRFLKLDFDKDTSGSSGLERSVMVSEKSCNEKKVQETGKAFILPTDVYNYRNSRKERVFIPENALGSANVIDKVDSDFISVGKDSDLPALDPKYIRNKKKKTRYVDIHAEDETISEMRDDTMQVEEFVSLDANSNDRVGGMDSEILYETKSTILGISDKSSLTFLEDDKLRKLIDNRNKNFKYESLKVKRLQGNSNRIKATKDPKRNKE